MACISCVNEGDTFTSKDGKGVYSILYIREDAKHFRRSLARVSMFNPESGHGWMGVMTIKELLHWLMR